MVNHECIQMDNISKIFDKLDTIERGQAVLLELKDDIKRNSEFRIQSKGVLGLMAFFFTAFGAAIFWIITKLSN